jgi:hypothetical protein
LDRLERLDAAVPRSLLQLWIVNAAVSRGVIQLGIVKVFKDRVNFFVHLYISKLILKIN